MSVKKLYSLGYNFETVVNLDCTVPFLRIKDIIVQIAQLGSVIGTNQATSDAGNDYTYGSNISVWDTSLVHGDLSTLQVAVKYTSGDIPHKDTAYVYSVQLKIHYT